MKIISKYLLKSFAQHVRCMSIRPKKSHYDALGISPNATQKEIKSAYYKLSMVYHPDKANDEASLQKFRDITEAYEVLGNIKTRKLYDKGLYFRTSAAYDDPLEKFRQARDIRSKAPTTSTGRTPVYDFDEWSKQHYGSTFRRKMETKKAAENYRVDRQQQIQNNKVEYTVMAITALALICMMCFNKKDHDEVYPATSLGFFISSNNNKNNPKDFKKE